MSAPTTMEAWLLGGGRDDERFARVRYEPAKGWVCVIKWRCGFGHVSVPGCSATGLLQAMDAAWANAQAHPFFDMHV